jgi:hypothetical protein
MDSGLHRMRRSIAGDRCHRSGAKGERPY